MLILPLVVLLYYFFRKKYTDQAVSSTLFWREVMQETSASPYFKHLQKNMLLYLQLLALLLLVFALLQPYFKTTKIAGSQVIWIVDTSATLLAGKEGESIFEKHLTEMRELASNLGEKPLTIITTGNSPQAIIRQETNATEIKQAIESLEVTYEAQQLSKTFDVAQAFVGDETTSIYVFTDVVERQELPLENDHVKWIVRGAEGDLVNVAMTKFAATINGSVAIALVQLTNNSELPQSFQLTLTNDAGDVVAKEAMTIEPLEVTTKLFKELPISTTLAATIDVEDDYTADNDMLTLLQQGTSQIIVEQSMHQLVQKGFSAVNANVKLMQSDALANVGRDAVIVTNQTKLLKQAMGPVFFIGRDDMKAVKVNQTVDVSKDALFAFSALEDVYVEAVYPGFDGYTTIATIGEHPFIQRSPKGDIVVLADLQSTDWPLHPSFPLFLWSVQSELAEGGTNLGLFTPNEERSIVLTPGEWSIYDASNGYIASIEDGKQFLAPTVPGLYSLQTADEQKYFIVQLAAQERIIHEGTSFELGQLTATNEEQTANRSIVNWILIIVLLVLVIEWEVQRRRGFTN